MICGCQGEEGPGSEVSRSAPPFPTLLREKLLPKRQEAGQGAARVRSPLSMPSAPWGQHRKWPFPEGPPCPADRIPKG